MIKGFLFDLDGVIVDTAKYHFLAWKRLADELSIPFTEDDNELLKGVSRMRSLDIILELGKQNLSIDVKEKLAAKKNAWYVDYIIKMTPGGDFARSTGIYSISQSAENQNSTWLSQ